MFTQTKLKKNQCRLGLPSKGRMYEESLEFLKTCGLEVRRNRRDYLATIEVLPNIQIVFQRQEDIVKGVANGMLSFGITGFDLVNEIPENLDNITIIHEELGFGNCTLEIAVPEKWPVSRIDDLEKNRTYRVASKFPKLTSQFFEKYGINYQFVEGAGTLEVSPALGNSDFIVDLVSTGKTLEDNRLKRLEDGKILSSQATFIGNSSSLQDDNVLQQAKTMLEYFEATLRAEKYVSVFVNFRGIADDVVPQLFDRVGLSGLQGPTVSQVITKSDDPWFAIHIIVDKSRLAQAIATLRNLGGSGVVVTPTMYIFEEQSLRYQKLVKEAKKERDKND